MWFSNTFQGTNWTLDEDVCVEFDDSFIIDKETQLAQMRQDAISFPDVKEFKILYVMERLNCEREEAIAYIDSRDPDVDDETED